MEKEKLGIYIHIPFCKSKCGYCDFCSHTPKKGETERYLNALMLNMQDFSSSAKGYSVDTVYIGGGTPTLLSKKHLKDLVDCVFTTFNVEKGAEITIEANPGTVDKSTLRALVSAGVNRISFGFQSASDKELRALGRIHTVQEFADSFKAARSAGFKNINVDLMYGIPHQTEDSFAKTLEFVKSLSPEHISVYGLKIEEGTPFYEAQDSLPLPDEESEYRMYRTAHRMLDAAGYEHYEISNYARRGFRSKHNMRYWKDEKYLGFGVAAHSYFGGQRYAYTDDIEAYIREMEHPSSISDILSECTDIDVFTKETEYVMLRMRLFDGVDLMEYRREFGEDFMRKYGAKLERYINGGFVTANSTKCAFSLKGMYVSNYILSEILDF
ncbi:MAG: radical SAM family heme chaperone HemW [Clostridia bacterium]|nr:radical SAM family heme chaperone HemW [Clostridia bacterium]